MSYKHVKLSRSDVKGKKYKMEFYNKDKQRIKTIHFGAIGYSDYTKHKDDSRKANYISRHQSSENWNVPDTAGSLSRWILWNHKSLNESYKSYLNKFNLTKL
ncbi:hypothetical protein GUITHDRAFT_67308 [Guillardia theta CCMP2712]|uniref:Uncharacterized protein n=1 Tax=Guillardia theta (strain CCMP2712) TaxID=905079 RepID=L1JPD2_GUITC|nr:hypothetical protein GUITHDRAFT_67308 [Guillardia theta CCMP2712]EKX50060.1 hypothetical protein GUITHDRAFT_67308 [Guillardia theta CCMP2712]|eukprot:XP_005837040.1 hypothetical protein GUITHDRAFT_67308 [Guillardia theta CCMP2712]